MAVLAALCAAILILAVLWDAFETIILPRRSVLRLRLAILVDRAAWYPYSTLGRLIQNISRRETFLSFYGPLALLLVLEVWAMVLIVGFALFQWALGSQVAAPEKVPTFGTDLYLSGTTFFTLGLGDVAPRTPPARVLTVVEAGSGFAILAVVIGYLPVLYQAFSRREVQISLLDARAGSPPSAVELLRRYSQRQHIEDLYLLLRSWELWAAELMESHLSYPALGYFRSQHEQQSWVATLTTVLDVCTLLLVGIDGIPPQTAQLTFAMARHAAADLCQVFTTVPHMHPIGRLQPTDLTQVRAALAAAGFQLREGEMADQHFEQLRDMYEPYVKALADRLLMSLPLWLPGEQATDNWQTSIWQCSTPAVIQEQGRSMQR